MHDYLDPQEQNVSFGDSSWGMKATWRWVGRGDSILVTSIVRYKNLLAHLALNAGELSEDEMETYQQLVQDRLYQVGG